MKKVSHRYARITLNTFRKSPYRIRDIKTKRRALSATTPYLGIIGDQIQPIVTAKYTHLVHVFHGQVGGERFAAARDTWSRRIGQREQAQNVYIFDVLGCLFNFVAENEGRDLTSMDPL